MELLGARSPTEFITTFNQVKSSPALTAVNIGTAVDAFGRLYEAAGSGSLSGEVIDKFFSDVASLLKAKRIAKGADGRTVASVAYGLGHVQRYNADLSSLICALAEKHAVTMSKQVSFLWTLNLR